MTSELVSGKEAGRQQVTQAILGLLLALGAYAILNTINPDLLDIGLSRLPTATITIPDDDTPQTPINGKYCTNTAGANGGYTDGADWTAIAGNPAALNSKITVKSSSGNTDCKKVGEQGCTSVRGLIPGFVNKLQLDCKCDIILTAGTECWLHGAQSQSTKHHPGSATVDLSLNMTPGLNKYLTGQENFTADNKKYPLNNPICLAEINKKNGDHWHCDGTGGGTPTSTGSESSATTESFTVQYGSTFKGLVIKITGYDNTKNHKLTMWNSKLNKSVYIQKEDISPYGNTTYVFPPDMYSKFAASTIKVSLYTNGVGSGTHSVDVP